MKTHPFTITSKILNLVAEILSIVGESRAYSIAKPNLKLRKQNKIKTIHHSLAIEGNTLTEAQIGTILDGNPVIGPKDQILEVKNAIEVYDLLDKLNPFSEQDLLKAHKILMKGLISSPGKYRNKAVGIFKDGVVSKISPSHKQVPLLMGNLIDFIKNDPDTHLVLKACIFHYEFEFIHPFEDGNGRMGRLWQQLILTKVSEIFEFLPIESLIHKNQKHYYRALEISDKDGESTKFIEFSLELILKTLNEYSPSLNRGKPKVGDRIGVAVEHFKSKQFSRKDYMNLHKGISSATASRDLAQGVEEAILEISGTKSQALYKKSKRSC